MLLPRHVVSWPVSTIYECSVSYCGVHKDWITRVVATFRSFTWCANEDGGVKVYSSTNFIVFTSCGYWSLEKMKVKHV